MIPNKGGYLTMSNKIEYHPGWMVMEINVGQYTYDTMPWYIKLRFKLTQLVLMPLLIRLKTVED